MKKFLLYTLILLMLLGPLGPTIKHAEAANITCAFDYVLENDPAETLHTDGRIGDLNEDSCTVEKVQ